MEQTVRLRLLFAKNGQSQAIALMVINANLLMDFKS